MFSNFKVIRSYRYYGIQILIPVTSDISLTFMEKHGGPINDSLRTPYSVYARFEVAPFRDVIRFRFYK